MTKDDPATGDGNRVTPAFGDVLAPAHKNSAILDALRLRRSTQADLLTEPGPDAASLETILTIAARVPDHRRVCPYRFVLFQGDARAAAGEVIAKTYAAENQDADGAQIAKERGRFLRAPIVIGVVSSVDKNHRTPEWEQVLTAGAVCQNMLIAANASGFAAQWLTEWYCYSPAVLAAFGVQHTERVAGFIYLGTAREWPKERQRAALAPLITHFGESPS